MSSEDQTITEEGNEKISKWGFILPLAIIGILSLTGAFSIFKLVIASHSIITHFNDPIEIVAQLGKELKKDENGRTNILLLGGGGLAHDNGSDLTDTLMVASLDYENHQVYLMSVPRDLFIEIKDIGFYRINTLWPIGVANYEEGHEADLAKSAFESILGIPIQYYLKVDFIGFEKVIDAVGGIDVVVERTFTDSEYPDYNYGYMTVSFEAGPQHLNGKKALQYARSRHGTNNEGGDFARAKRQQNVIQAIREKALNLGLFGKPEKIEEVITTINDHYKTDITNAEMLSLLGFAKNLKSNSIHTMVIKEGPGELLYVPTEEVRAKYYGGAYVLLPDGDDFEIIHDAVHKFLTEPALVNSGPTVEILNGTTTPNLANYVATELMRNDIRIYPNFGIRNTYSHSGYDKTLIYDHSRGGNIETVKQIQSLIGGEICSDNPEPQEYPVDITVILGDDFEVPEDLDRILGEDVDITIDNEFPSEDTGDTNDSL